MKKNNLYQMKRRKKMLNCQTVTADNGIINRPPESFQEILKEDAFHNMCKCTDKVQ